ncbi:hypothetical protein Taro_018087 [Colocasia esculenta]|uniref:Exostosin GT47 domain-containing protein n=1 Tax=Colocasia esculenta TaxID=4460 RepID=A0A843UV79_COLES|nr:hypothetical protein [Colocasia esculenta]
MDKWVPAVLLLLFFLSPSLLFLRGPLFSSPVVNHAPPPTPSPASTVVPSSFPPPVATRAPPSSTFSSLDSTRAPPSLLRLRPVATLGEGDKGGGDDAGVLLEVEEGLARARAAIHSAAAASGRINSSTSPPPPSGGRGEGKDGNFVPAGEVYHNPAAFYRSYLEMERRFKVYVYEEGEPPLVHDGPCKNIYTTEGRFIHELEMLRGGRKGWPEFLTRDPRKAHAFFMPFSVAMMVSFLYKEGTYDHTPLRRFAADYVRVISSRHPFWNRTAGADHFMLSCHDWGPHVSRANPQLYANSIRVLCNANTSEGFDPRKDVSLPEINLYTGEMPARLRHPPPDDADAASRPFLAFFAGGDHGPIRPLLLRHWKGQEGDVRVYEYLPTGGGGATHDDYYGFLLKSRFCLCPSGYEVASPRVVEAIYAECVPVIISEGYVLPFSDVLRWEAFSVTVAVADIPQLRSILAAVTPDEYRRLRANLRTVKRHFVLNRPSRRFDTFYMILHSVWLRRLNTRLS